MGRAGLLAVAALAIVGGPCHAGGGKGLQARLPKIVTENNGLGSVVALRGGDFLSRVVLHFAGLDPPVEWTPFPKTAELFPAWMDEPVAMPARLSVEAFGQPACAEHDYGRLAARLQAEPAAPVPPAPQSHSDGLIRIETASSSAARPPAAGGGRENGLDMKTIYGGSCIIYAAP